MIDEKTQRALRMMTDIQARRWRLALHGRSITEIAAIEGVTRVAVHLSLRAGKKRARKKIADLELI
jgi:DNA-directed RNA polymerase specialized sigma24 family protein